jgi:hypothetical protein
VSILHVPTNPLAHYAFGALAWVGAALAARRQARRWQEETLRLSRVAAPSYFVTLAIGAQPCPIRQRPETAGTVLAR